MELARYCDLLNRNNNTTLVMDEVELYKGSVRSIPDKYMDCKVTDFTVDNNGNTTFYIA